MKKLFKKSIACLIAVLMIVSSLPFTAFAEEASDHYLFAYFTGNDAVSTNSRTSQAIRLATSEDGINFTPLKNNKPVIKQNGGTGNVRDPYIFEGQDGAYYIVATDLNAGQGGTGFWGNQPQIVFWKSTDLINWTDETYINTAQICGLNDNQVYRTWAPEVIWDSANNQYVVYFAFAADGYNSTTMYYMTTTDLLDQSKYSQPQQLFAPGGDAIDGDIVEQNGTFYMFYKDETEGRKNVCLATASTVTGPYTYQGVFGTSSSTGAIEGCEVYMIGDDYYLIADRYGASGNFAIYNLGTDLAKLTTKGEVISVSDSNPIKVVNDMTGFNNLSARHGSIIHITEAQYNAILEAYAPKTIDCDLGIIAKYFVDSDVNKDSTGHEKALSSTNLAWWNAAEHTGDWGSKGEDCVYFGGENNGNGYAEATTVLNNTGVTTKTGFSVEFDGFTYAPNVDVCRFVDITTNDTHYWTGEGLKTSSDTFDGAYVFLSGNGKLGVKAPTSNWDATTNSLAKYDREWHHYLLTVSSEEVKYYCDNLLMATLDCTEETLDAIINKGKIMFGKSSFTADAKLDGLMKNVKVYNKATDPQEIAETTEEDMLENYKTGKIVNASPESFNAAAYHTDRVATNGYSNVAWHGTWQTAWSGPSSRADATINIKNINYKIAMPTNIVLVYDGVNDVSYPTVIETKVSSKASCRIKTIFPYNNIVEFRDYWKGYTTDWQAYDLTVANETIGYAAGIDHETAQQDNTGTSRFWYNRLFYNGTGNTSAYYELINNLDFDVYSKKNSESYVDSTLYSAGSAYVLNYEPVYDILNERPYNEYIANKDLYTEDSYNTFFNAVKDITNLSINSIFADATAENVGEKVQEAANTIKTTVANYNTAVANLELASTIDTTAYDNAVAESVVIKGKTTEYTAKSLEEYSDLVDAVTKTYSTQEEYDSAAAAILSAKDVLRKATITITLHKQSYEGDVTTTTLTPTYGEKVELQSGFDSVTKWTIQTTDADGRVAETKLDRATSTIDLLAAKDCVVTVIEAEDARVSEKEYTTVKLYGKNGILVGIKYVEKGSEVVLKEEDAPKIAFYSFAGWSLEYETATEKSYYANYVFLDEDEDRCNVHYNGTVKSYAYDQYVYLGKSALDKTLALSTREDGYGLLTYIDGDCFYAPHTADIYVIEVGSKNNSTAITGSYVLSKAETDGYGVVLNCKFYANDMNEVQEFGVVITNPDTNGTKIVKADSASENNEYSVKVKLTTQNLTYIRAKSYVVINGVTYESAETNYAVG